MSLQLKKRNIKLSTVALASAAIVVAGVVVVNTFPHVKSSVMAIFSKSKPAPDSELEDSLVDISEWSDENLKSYLQDVCMLRWINP